MALFIMRHSVVGRRFGLSSTGGFIGTSSTVFDAVAVMRDSTGAVVSPHDEPVITSTSTGGATLAFHGGVTVINTSATAATFLIAAPTAGRKLEIFIQSSASALTFGGTSTSQVFMKVGGTSAGSTTLTLTDADLAGQSLVLRGMSATRFGVVHGSTVIQA